MQGFGLFAGKTLPAVYEGCMVIFMEREGSGAYEGRVRRMFGIRDGAAAGRTKSQKHYEKGEVNPMNNLKEKKLNNKGFSLVELIIVIAIMAVLIGVLAPQYLKYVERSRQSADLDTVDSMVSSVEIYSADPANNIVSGTITCSATGDITADAATLAALQDAGLASSTANTSTVLATMKSNAYKNWTISFTTDTNGNPIVQFGGTNGTALGTAMGRN